MGVWSWNGSVGASRREALPRAPRTDTKSKGWEKAKAAELSPGGPVLSVASGATR